MKSRWFVARMSGRSSCRMALAVASLLTFSRASPGAGDEILHLSRTVPLPGVRGGFDLMAADVAGQRLFLAAQDNNTLEVIDLAAARRTTQIEGLNEPKWVVYLPDSHRLFVSNGGDGSSGSSRGARVRSSTACWVNRSCRPLLCR